jgi:hypothetical protein
MCRYTTFRPWVSGIDGRCHTALAVGQSLPGLANDHHAGRRFTVWVSDQPHLPAAAESRSQTVQSRKASLRLADKRSHGAFPAPDGPSEHDRWQSALSDDLVQLRLARHQRFRHEPMMLTTARVGAVLAHILAQPTQPFEEHRRW